VASALAIAKKLQHKMQSVYHLQQCTE